MKFARISGEETRTALRMRTRLTISHISVSLAGIFLIVAFASGAMLQAARYAVEDQLLSLAIVSSSALADPLRGYLAGVEQLTALNTAAANLWARTPEIHYTVYLADGTRLLDSRSESSPSGGEVPPEVLEALQVEDSPAILVRPNDQGSRSLFAAVQITSEGQIFGIVSSETTLVTVSPTTRLYLVGLGLFSLLVIVGVSALGSLLARSQSAPSERLAVSARHMAGGKLNVRAAVEGQREVQTIAKALNLQAARVESSVNELRTFVASASHELRTPLTTVKLRAEALRAGALRDPEVSERFLTEIEDEIDRLSRMVNDLLDLSRIEAQVETAHYTKLNLGRIAAEVQDTFKVRTDECAINLDLNVDPDLPEICGDEEQLWRVLTNLIDNALNFTPSGGNIWISVTAVGGGSAARLEVKDTGPGILPEGLKHLFERFYRTDITRQRSSRSKGSGLGLAICKAIVENHGGIIGADSQLGEGAMFWVELPAL